MEFKKICLIISFIIYIITFILNKDYNYYLMLLLTILLLNNFIYFLIK